jgi:3-phosphoshikimate 1-carboxyvinyltransferase
MPTAPLAIPKCPQPPLITWPVPGSKSISNRAQVLAALADGTSVLEGMLISDDTRHMRTCLEAMGIVMKDADETTLVVEGGRQRLRVPRQQLDVGNSGTTVRFLTALAALMSGDVTLTGDAAMAKRPLKDLIDGLSHLGVKIDCPTGCPPLTVHGRGLRGGHMRMRGGSSSQYFSAVMMAGSLADADIDITIDGDLVSKPYVAITRRMIADFGGRVDQTASGFAVRHIPGFRNRTYRIEPDASSASYAFAAAAVTGGEITVPGLSATSLQGDVAFVEILRSLGAEVDITPGRIAVRGTGTLRGVDVDMHHISDTVMTLAAIAPLCSGPTMIRNIGNIRIKETDRLSATATELRRLGQTVETGDDWLRITPKPLLPAVIDCYDDHRMAMSFAVLGLARGGITIADPDCTAKTYPEFWRDLARCYPQAPW